MNRSQFKIKLIKDNVAIQMPLILDRVETIIEMIYNRSCEGYKIQFIKHCCEPSARFIDESMQSLKAVCQQLKTQLDSEMELKVNKLSFINRKLTDVKFQLISARNDLLYFKEEINRTFNALYKCRKHQKEANLEIPESSTIHILLSLFGTYDKKEHMRINRAKEERARYGCKVKKLTHRLEYITVKMMDTEHACELLGIEKETLQQSINLIEETNNHTVKFLSMFSIAFHEITVTCGRSHVFYTQIKHGYKLDPLKPLFEEFLESFLSFSKNDLFKVFPYIHTFQIQNMMKRIETASRRVSEPWIIPSTSMTEIMH